MAPQQMEREKDRISLDLGGAHGDYKSAGELNESDKRCHQGAEKEGSLMAGGESLPKIKNMLDQIKKGHNWKEGWRKKGARKFETSESH